MTPNLINIAAIATLLRTGSGASCVQSQHGHPQQPDLSRCLGFDSEEMVRSGEDMESPELARTLHIELEKVDESSASDEMEDESFEETSSGTPALEETSSSTPALEEIIDECLKFGEILDNESTQSERMLSAVEDEISMLEISEGIPKEDMPSADLLEIQEAHKEALHLSSTSARLPSECSLSRELQGLLGPGGMKDFVLTTELYFLKLKKLPDQATARSKALTFYKFFMSREGAKNQNTPEYLHGVFHRQWVGEINLINYINDIINDTSTSDQLREHLRFFSRTHVSPDWTSLVITHIGNLLSLKPVRTVIFAAFKMRCFDSKLAMQFQTLYEALFTPKLGLAMADLLHDIISVEKVGDERRVPPSSRRAFNICVEQLVAEIFKVFSRFTELIVGLPACDRACPAMRFLGDLRVNLYSGLMISNEAVELLWAARHWVKVLNHHLGDDASAVSYRIWSVGYLLAKLNSCVYNLLFLLFRHDNHLEVINSLETALKQMLFHQVDSDKAKEFLKAASRCEAAVDREDNSC